MFGYIESLFNDPLAFLIMLCYRAPAILIALMFHEVAHGYVAYRLGDPTAKYMGRLSLNPIKHLDPIGTFMLFLFGFGWAKPVPVNPNNFKNVRRDDLLVSLAGPVTNFILCFFSVGIYVLLWKHMADIFPTYESYFGMGYRIYEISMTFLQYFFSINIALFVFNLIPVPPLDGYHVVNDLFFKRSLFANPQTARMASTILMLLAFSGFLGEGLSVVMKFFLDGIQWFYLLFIR